MFRYSDLTKNITILQTLENVLCKTHFLKFFFLIKYVYFHNTFIFKKKNIYKKKYLKINNEKNYRLKRVFQVLLQFGHVDFRIKYFRMQSRCIFISQDEHLTSL